MLDNPKVGELDSAVDVRRRCKKNSPYILSCIDKRTNDGCDRGSEVGTVHSQVKFILSQHSKCAKGNSER